MINGMLFLLVSAAQAGGVYESDDSFCCVVGTVLGVCFFVAAARS